MKKIFTRLKRRIRKRVVNYILSLLASARVIEAKATDKALSRVSQAYVHNEFRPSPKTRLSVVLGSYNRLPLLKVAINSVRKNEIPVDYEIIVVDGGSTDGSLEWLLGQKDIVTIVQHNRGKFRDKNIERRSWGYFMNLAFKAAQGDWVLMISDDCLLLDGAIQNSLVMAEKMWRSGRKIGGVALYFRNWPDDEKFFVSKTAGGFTMVNHGLFLRRALIDVGYANEDDFMFYKADGDLSLRIWHAGYEIVDCPRAFVEHFFHKSELTRRANDAFFEKDQKMYVNRWGHLAGQSGKHEIEVVPSNEKAEKVFRTIREELYPGE